MPFDPFFKSDAKWDYAHFLHPNERIEYDKLLALPHDERLALRSAIFESQQRFSRVHRAFLQAPPETTFLTNEQ